MVNKKYLLAFFVFLALILIILILNINNASVNSSAIGEKQITAVQENNICNKSVRIYFNIDDITFTSDQKPFLENMVTIAKKYNLSFGLGVIADRFDKYKDNNTFQVYLDNKDVFEIYAHGFIHREDERIANTIPYGSYGEFDVAPDPNYDVPAYIQEDHIASMVSIFEKYNLTFGTEMFVVPYHKGDWDTIVLAEKYGYRIIVMQLSNPKNFSEQKYGNIIATEDYIDIPQINQSTTDDFKGKNIELNQAIKLGQRDIYISMHPVNFQNLTNADSFFNAVVSLKDTNSAIVFSRQSDRLNC